MKKLLSLILSFVMVISVLYGLNITAIAEVYGDFGYSFDYSPSGRLNTVSINAYYGNETDLVIPSSINGRNVTKIIVNGDNSDSGSNFRFVKSITLPDTVNILDESNDFFNVCFNLEAFYVSENNEYFSTQDGVLFNKDKSKLICYPKAKQDTKYTIPNGVKTLASSSFNNCVNLKELTISNSMLNYNISNSSISSISGSCFRGCYNLEGIYALPDNPFYCSLDGVIFDKNEKNLIVYPCGKNKMSYKIPDEVTGIASYAFYNCNILKSIMISKNVTNIGDYAFSGCYFTENNFINNSLITDKYKGAIIVDSDNNGFCVINDDLLCMRYNYAKGDITIPGNIKNIDYSAFRDCKDLTKVIVSNSVTNINGGAFCNCINLNTLMIPRNVMKIGYCAFGNCISLKDVYYDGTQEDWNNLDIYDGNAALFIATIHYSLTSTSSPTPTPSPAPSPAPNPAPIPTPTQPTTTPTTAAKAVAKPVSKPKSAKIKKVKAAKKAVSVEWKKVSGVKGYQIQVATDKKFKKNKKTATVKKQKTTKVTIKKLKAKKKYYVRMRTYKTLNGKKIYSSWSKIKNVKTK